MIIRRPFTRWTVLALLASVFAVNPPVRAEDPLPAGSASAAAPAASSPAEGAETTPGTDRPATRRRTDTVPFRGKVAAVDKAAMKVLLEGKERQRAVLITSKTRIMKAGKPAVFDDIQVGEELAGAAKKLEDGLYEAASLRVGPKPERAPKKTKEPKEPKNEEPAKE